MIVTQPWTHELPMMQQSVLLSAIRGPDGLPKYAGVKMLLRWYRRCVLLCAMDGRVIGNPLDEGGGSFIGPSVKWTLPHSLSWRDLMDDLVDDYLRELDGIPYHFQMHFMHGVEILGYRHPNDEIRNWWRGVYERLVHDMHLHPEAFTEMMQRLGDNREGWLARSDPATTS
jgi:hypothetical protein